MKAKALATTHLVVLMSAAAIIARCSCTKGPKGLSSDTYEGVRRTAAALRRANEYRDSGALLFEPRLLEAEKEADGIVAPRAYSVTTEANNAAAAVVARSCVKDLQLYRDIRSLSNAEV